MERIRWNITRSNLRKRAVKRVNLMFSTLNEDNSSKENAVNDNCIEENMEHGSFSYKSPPSCESEMDRKMEGFGETTSDEDASHKRKKTSSCTFKKLQPAPKIKGPGFNVKSALQRQAVHQTTRSDSALLVSPIPRRPPASPELTIRSPNTRCPVASPEPQRQECQQSAASNSTDFASVLHRILTNQEMIMDQLKLLRLTMQKTEAPGEQDPLDRETLPLKDTTSLLDLERRLREDPDLKNKMITSLSVIGGVDVKDSVWRVMKQCLTNSLAKRLNWRGIDGKTPFHQLQLKDVVTRTVRNNRLTSTATDQEIESFIKRWLHLAGDRDGGRRQREERRQAAKHSLEDFRDCRWQDQDVE